MYLYLGQDYIVHTGDIVGIFDLDTSSLSKKTKEYLARAEKEKRVINTSYELPKSFVIVQNGGRHSVYVSQLSAATLKGRAGAVRRRFLWDSR